MRVTPKNARIYKTKKTFAVNRHADSVDNSGGGGTTPGGEGEKHRDRLRVGYRISNDTRVGQWVDI